MPCRSICDFDLFSMRLSASNLASRGGRTHSAVWPVPFASGSEWRRGRGEMPSSHALRRECSSQPDQCVVTRRPQKGSRACGSNATYRIAPAYRGSMPRLRSPLASTWELNSSLNQGLRRSQPVVRQDGCGSGMIAGPSSRNLLTHSVIAPFPKRCRRAYDPTSKVSRTCGIRPINRSSHSGAHSGRGGASPPSGRRPG